MPQIDFRRSHNGLAFRDALVLTEGEFAALSDEDIEAMKNARFEAWVASLTTPPEE